MNAVSKWYHKRPKSYYPKCVEMFGEPTSISNTKHGFAFWKTRGLFDEHILRDEDVKHCVPRNHHDYFYSSIKFFIPEDKVFDVLKISGSINYDGLKNLITARCGGIGANYATLYLGMMVAMGKMTIKEVQSDDLYPKHISGEMKTYNEMKKEMMAMKRANHEKFKKELKQDFAPYAFKQCYKEKSGGGICGSKPCNAGKTVRSDGDIRAAVNAWCEGPEAAEVDYGHISHWNTSAVTDMSDLFKYQTYFNDDISRWNVANVKNMRGMFWGARAFNQPIGGWNISNVTNMEEMFAYAYAFDQPLANWERVGSTLGQVTNMEMMFYRASRFNKPIGGWNVDNVTNMKGMLYEASDFDQPIGDWNVANVTNMQEMFYRASDFNEPIWGWNVGNVTNMKGMFDGARAFNQSIGDWNVSNVTNMEMMFKDASAFNQPLANWERVGSTLGQVTNMEMMFYRASRFNKPIGGWNVDNVTTMSHMFAYVSAFNQPIGEWNVANVTNMQAMFLGAYRFNRPIGGWNVGNVTDMNGMFNNARAFNQPLEEWNVSNVTNMEGMFSGARAFNQPLANWEREAGRNGATTTSTLTYVTNMQSMFENADSFDQDISDWYIPDANTTKMFNESYHHTKPSATLSKRRKFYQAMGDYGIYDMAVEGSLYGGKKKRTRKRNTHKYGSKTKSKPKSKRTQKNKSGGGICGSKPCNADITVRSDGDIKNAVKLWCRNRTRVEAETKYGHISDWDTSAVTNMSELFRNCREFNDDISRWNLGNVTNMDRMFFNATAFNQPIGEWNVGNVTNMDRMFFNASAFNQPLANWERVDSTLGQVTNMDRMFFNATAFNQPIGEWNVGNVTNMDRMFWDASTFNRPIGDWDVGNVTTMERMFAFASAFNQPLGHWNVGNVTNMEGMFCLASTFNKPIGGWNVGNVTNMAGMFEGAIAFNQPLEEWNVSNVTNMDRMFRSARAFNQPLANWEREAGRNGATTTSTLTYVTNMQSMFENADSFDQDISNWYIPNADTTNMFNESYNPNHTKPSAALSKLAISYKAMGSKRNLDTATVIASMVGGKKKRTRKRNTRKYGSKSKSKGTQKNKSGGGICGSKPCNANKIVRSDEDIRDADKRVRSDGDIKNAVELWCREPVAAELEYGHISEWNTSAVTDMSDLFKYKTNFNHDITRWNVANVKNMRGMFWMASAFNQPIGGWNVSNVTNMQEMFSDAYTFNQPLANWERIRGVNGATTTSTLTNVTNMSYMFSVASRFNQPIGGWNVGNVTDMNGMFSGARAFNQPIGDWNVGNVTNMKGMFSDACAFNQPLEQWNVANVTNMSYMFSGARAFNQPLEQWNVANVTNMRSMFYEARAFNQPLANWERIRGVNGATTTSTLTNVTNMWGMFWKADSFDQDIGNWNIPNANTKNMFNEGYNLDKPSAERAKDTIIDEVLLHHKVKGAEDIRSVIRQFGGKKKRTRRVRKSRKSRKTKRTQKLKKELKQDFAPYAFKQCYKEKSGGGNCTGKTCNDKEIEGIRHQIELAEEELAKRDKEQQDQELLRELKHALYTEKEKYGNWVFVPPEKLEKGKKYTVEVTRNMSDSKMPNPLLKQNMEFVRSDNLSDEPLLRFIEGKDNDGNDKYFAVRNTRDNRIYKLEEYGDTSLEDQIKNSKSTDELHALSKEALNKATNFNADLNRYIGEFGGSRTKTSSKGTLRKKETKNGSKSKSKGTQKSKSASKEKRVGKGLINTRNEDCGINGSTGCCPHMGPDEKGRYRATNEKTTLTYDNKKYELHTCCIMCSEAMNALARTDPAKFKASYVSRYMPNGNMVAKNQHTKKEVQVLKLKK